VTKANSTKIGVIVVVLISGLGYAAIRWSSAPATGSSSGVTMELPDRIGDWYGYEAEVSALEKKVLPSDTGFARKFYFLNDDKNTPSLLLSIVLSGKDRMSIHRPEACLEGQGWATHSWEIFPVQINEPQPYTVEVMKMDNTREVRKTGTRIRNFYCYWFISANRTTPRHFERIFFTSWDLMLKNVANRWAYVVVATMVPPGREDHKFAEIKDFIAQAAPHFQYIDGLPEYLVSTN